MIWFTSDEHFFHKNILKYRPMFSSVEEMNKVLIQNFNKCVKNKDIVYILGDFSFGNIEQTENILQKLNGHKILILGNHDRKNIYKKQCISQYFDAIYDYFELKYNHQTYILCHYPFETWRGKNNGSIHLYGHVHLNNNKLNYIPNRFHIGVDTNNFTPVSIDFINQFFQI